MIIMLEFTFDEFTSIVIIIIGQLENVLKILKKPKGFVCPTLSYFVSRPCTFSLALTTRFKILKIQWQHVPPYSGIAINDDC